MKKDIQHFRAKPIVIILVLIISNLNLNAQHCGWDWFYQNMFDTKGERMIFFDSFEENIRTKLNSIRNISTRSKIEIPIVFHIIKNPSDRYIDDGVLLAQIDRLNEDFTALNLDMENLPNEFKDKLGASNMQFCIANLETSGEIKPSIIRKSTNRAQFGLTDDLYYDHLGGSNAWDTEIYINIWIADTGPHITGFATLPEIVESERQGIIIHPDYVGPNYTTRYNLGRVLTHELGHYFGLIHIWGGSGRCFDDDGVEDTPVQANPYFGCPRHPQQSCESPDLFMNYMDYVDDECMIMFTSGQINRMDIVRELHRPNLGKIGGHCTHLNSFNLTFEIAPNPGHGIIEIFIEELDDSWMNEIEIYDIMGRVVYSGIRHVYDGTIINISEAPNGVYLIKIGNKIKKYIKTE